MGTIQNVVSLPVASAKPAVDTAPFTAPQPERDTLVDRHESLIRELVVAKHNQARNNTIALRAYQLRDRQVVSSSQQASFVVATGHFGIYALPVLPVLETTFTVKRQAAKSLSFHVWKRFTEHAKSKPQQKAIHGALKRHGIIHHENTLWGAMGRNHFRTLDLPTDANGELSATDLQLRMRDVIGDLALSGLWTDEQLSELVPDITQVVEQFALLVHDLNQYGEAWGKANIAAKKLVVKAKLSESNRAALIETRSKRADLKHRIVVGDDVADKQLLQEEVDTAIARSRTYTGANTGDGALVAHNEALLRELVVAKHKEFRDNEIAFRDYQLRPRKLLSNVQQASFVGLTAHFGAYVLPALPHLAKAFTVKRYAAQSLSFHVWKQFTEYAKDKPQQKAIHGALKRHGIVHHEKTVWGWLGRNHWRTLELPTDDTGHIEANLLGERMDEVMADLSVAGLWSGPQLRGLRADITTILQYFASLTADLHNYSDAWGKANRDVKAHWLGSRFSAEQKQKYQEARAKRADIKHHITVGDDTADDAKLARELEAVLSVG